MTAGRLGEARTLAGRMFQDSVRELHLAVVAETVDDFQTLRTHMSRIPPEWSSGRSVTCGPACIATPMTSWRAQRVATG